MGRPKKDSLSVRSKQLRIRLTETEYYWINVLSKKDNKTASQLLRNCVIEHIRNTYNDDEIANMAAKVASELRKKKKPDTVIFDAIKGICVNDSL